MSNGFPIKVTLRYSSVDKPIPALLYDIHYNTEDGNPMGTCWLLDSNSWMICQLAFITPELPKEKKILKE